MIVDVLAVFVSAATLMLIGGNTLFVLELAVTPAAMTVSAAANGVFALELDALVASIVAAVKFAVVAVASVAPVAVVVVSSSRAGAAITAFHSAIETVGRRSPSKAVVVDDAVAYARLGGLVGFLSRTPRDRLRSHCGCERFEKGLCNGAFGPITVGKLL